jgi:protein-disulfide isomerase
MVSVAGGAVKGDQNAKITMIEFTDYQCPFCSRHFRAVMPQIETDYVKTGKVKYVLRDFPLESIHPNAFKAAEAANCSGEQGRYWEMHDRLFGNQNTLGAKELPDHAKAVGLELPKFQQCFDSGKYSAKVRKDFVDAQKYGATGTPTFFLGLTDPKGSEVKAVKRIVGAQSYSAFKDAIDSLLAAEN